MTPRRLQSDRLAAVLAEPAVMRVLSALAAQGEETRLVGGCVRDALLGRPVSDIDLATTLLPKEVMNRADAATLKAIPTGIDHGTVSIITHGATFEVTTLREDIETDGRHAVVRFGRDFTLDAARRDFTINALSLDVGGTLHDTTDGVADLKAGRVRFIGDATTRIREDALRILRFFRFHARYGIGALDEEGLRAAIAAAGLLDHLSRERVRSELLKLLEAPGALSAIATMSETGLLARILGSDGHLDRLEHVTAAPAANALPTSETYPGPIRYGAAARLAALAVDSAEDAGRLRQTLRLSNEEHALLDAYAAARREIARLPSIDAMEMRRLAATQSLESLLVAVDAMNGDRTTSDARLYLERLRSGEEAAPIFPLAGADLVAAGITPGRSFGGGLSAARALWLQQGCPEGEEERAILLAHALGAIGANAPT